MDQTTSLLPAQIQRSTINYLVKIFGTAQISYTCTAESRHAAVQEALERHRREYPTHNVRSCTVLEQNSKRMVLTLFAPQLEPMSQGI